MREHKGFGLLELVIAIAVMAIIAAFALPSVLDWRANAELRAVTEDIRKTMKLARSWAVKEKETAVVEFEKDYHNEIFQSYWAFVDNVKDPNMGWAWKYNPGEPMVYKNKVSEAVSIGFIDPVTGEPSEYWHPEVKVFYPQLLDSILRDHDYLVENYGVASGLFPVGFQESKIHFTPPHTPGQPYPCYQAYYDGQEISGWCYEGYMPRYKILFEPNSECTTSVIIELANVEGQKYQIEITAYGISEAAKVD